MTMLSILQENQMLTRLKNVSGDQVKNAFFANYLAALVMMKLKDIDSMHIINDPQGAPLTSFKSQMSDINFWGRVLFHSDKPDIKSRMMFGHAEALNVESGRITDGGIKKVMKVPLTAADQVNWTEVVAMLVLLKHRFSMSSSYMTNLIRHLHTWESMSSSGRRKAVNDAFMYLMQSDPKSSLLPRVRALSNSTMIDIIDGTFKKLIGFKRINEEEGGGADGGTSVGSIATGDSGLTSNLIVRPPEANTDMGPHYNAVKKSDRQVTKKSKLIIKDGKIIKKRVKGFRPRKFKLPDYLRATKSKTSEKNVAVEEALNHHQIRSIVHNDITRKTQISVKEFLKLVKNSTLPQADVDSIVDTLKDSGVSTRPLKRHDLEQISAIADVNLGELLSLVGWN